MRNNELFSIAATCLNTKVVEVLSLIGLPENEHFNPY
jgi:hypothetical protein